MASRRSERRGGGLTGIIKVVSASLFSVDPHAEPLERYWVGACAQALAVRELLPDYQFWIYVNHTVPDYIKDALVTLRSKVVEVADEWRDSPFGYYWRFLPCGESAVERVYVCDADLEITPSEVHSVREWERLGVSVLHRPWYNPEHGPARPHEHRRVAEGRHLLACALGVRWPFGKDVREQLRLFFSTLGTAPVYGHDEIFLSQFIWPRLAHSNSLHETFDEGIAEGRDMAELPSVLGKRKRQARSSHAAT